MDGWTRSVVPNFVYWYFIEMGPWPTNKEIETCGQQLWDWRFGDTQLLDLAKSPQHLQLVSFPSYPEILSEYFLS